MKTFVGWLFISIALGISVYANYNCSFGCGGVYGIVINPLSVAGFLFYVIGTIIFLLPKGEETTQSIEVEGGENVKAENIIIE